MERRRQVSDKRNIFNTVTENTFYGKKLLRLNLLLWDVYTRQCVIFSMKGTSHKLWWVTVKDLYPFNLYLCIKLNFVDVFRYLLTTIADMIISINRTCMYNYLSTGVGKILTRLAPILVMINKNSLLSNHLPNTKKWI